MLESYLLEFFLNGAEHSLNSVNSANSVNLINNSRMNWAQFKDLVCHLCLAGTVVASWSLTQEVAGLSPFTVKTNILPLNSVKTLRKNSISSTLHLIIQCTIVRKGKCFLKLSPEISMSVCVSVFRGMEGIQLVVFYQLRHLSAALKINRSRLLLIPGNLPQSRTKSQKKETYGKLKQLF